MEDDAVRSILSQPLTPFSPPSRDSKSDFDTKFAPIHVQPSNDGQYDINQIKEDAQWLSKQADINEIAAGRIVILEWQQRAASQLLSEWSEEERISVQNASSNANFQPSTSAFPDPAPDAATQHSHFNNDENRRARLFTILYAEQTSILTLSTTLIAFNLPRDLHAGHGPAYSTRSTQDIARAAWAAQTLTQEDTNARPFFVQCIDALRIRLTMLDPSRWPEFVSSNVDLAGLLVRSSLNQMVAILRLAFLHTFNSQVITSAQSVRAWFELMDQSRFLAELPDPGAPDTVVLIHCLVSIISVDLIKSKAILDRLFVEVQADDGAYPNLPGASYWEDDQCIRLITQTVITAIEGDIRHAGPAVLAWSVVCNTLRDARDATVENRQLTDDASSDIEGSPAPPRTRRWRNPDGPRNHFETKLDLIMDITHEDTIAIMVAALVNQLEPFDSIISISEYFLLIFSAKLDAHIIACVKTILFGLLREASPLFRYSTELTQALLSVLSYDTVPPNLSTTRIRTPAEPVKSFLAEKNGTMSHLLSLLQQRYSYELRPFLRCALSISQGCALSNGDQSPVLAMLESMPAFTQLMPVHFRDYEMFQEDIVRDHIVLTKPWPIFTSRNPRSGHLSLMSGRETERELFTTIPEGTIGALIKDTRPFIVTWQHQHSGLGYLGTLLSTRLPNASVVDSSTGVSIDRDSAAEIVALIDSLVSSEISADNLDSAKLVLGNLSLGLDRNVDILKVVFDVFEEELQAQIDQPGLEGSLYLLVHCIRLMQTIVSLYPERIWSLMTRSKLLSVSDSTGALAAIVSGTEMPLGQYDFLRCCVGLFESLIDDGVKRAVSRKTVSKAVTRFEAPADLSGSTPEKLMSAVLASFQRIFLDVLQSSPSWKFVFPTDRYDMNARILSATTSILDYSYSIDDDDKVASKLTAVFTTATEVILKVFLAEHPHELTFHPLLNILTSALAGHSITPALSMDLLIKEQACAALSFCSTVLDVGLLSARRGEYLTTNLLQTMPLLARIFATHPYYKAPVANVLTSITRTLNHVEAPPSLLGHLGSNATKCFLAVVSQLDQPIEDLDAEVVIWNMLSAVVSNKQQWLAICLLTGATPRDRLKGGEKNSLSSNSKPLLGYALNKLSNIRMLSPKRAMAILEFVAQAQDHWSWATSGIGKHAGFIKSITDWLTDLTPNARPSDLEAVTRTANENQIAALIANILARYLHHAKQMGDVTTVNTVATKLNYLRDHGVAVDGYNHSLHKNLSQNFTSRFPQCSLTNFKRTGLRREQFGHEYYYDRHLAGKMLDFEPSYSRKNGFQDELARANVNMSLVESQVNLLRSWKALTIGLGNFTRENDSLEGTLSVVVSNCLKANTETSVPAALFDNIAQIRADMAFVLLQKLTRVLANESEIRALLSTAWDTVRTCAQDFSLVSTPRDAEYYRTLLRVLFLALQPHIYYPTPLPKAHKSGGSRLRKNAVGATPAIANLLLELLERVVAVNVRALCSAVHTDANLTSPNDFVLLTALLQSILRVPGMTNAHASVAAVFATAGTARYVTSLYSWSDQLAAAAEVNDPVYGELSILFLLELSSVPLIAEQMAVDGVLSRLSAANLSQYLRKPAGKGPFDEPIRVYNIWMKGMLPLCLNLLEAVGPPIAAEIVSFLNSFPEQLRRAETDLENRNPTLRHPYAGSVTLNLAAEIHSLSLMSIIIERLKMAGPTAGVLASEIPSLAFDRAMVREEIEGMLRSRRGLRERILPVGEKEAEWARVKPTTPEEWQARQERYHAGRLHGKTLSDEERKKDMAERALSSKEKDAERERARMKAAADAENVLEMKIVTELDAALVCLTG